MELDVAIEEYIRENWEQVVRDIDSLVRIPSVEDLGAAGPGAPYGPEPARALGAALAIARRMGLDAHNCDGYIGYADLPGESPVQVGIIGHADVVPAGAGWAFPAYEVTRKDSYLVGRGVLDDKGPLVVAMHAVGFWKQRLQAQGQRLPYTVRLLIGANEETTMSDVAYYRQHFEDPAFLVTPDADFPVGYGEAGICHTLLTSAPIRGGRILELAGGVAVNAVPGEAHARIVADGMAFPQVDGIEVSVCDGVADVRAHGKAAHASAPHLGESAIDRLAAYLLATEALSADERAFLELVRKVTAHSDGSGVGLSCSDEHFGDLTAVGGVVSLRRDDASAAAASDAEEASDSVPAVAAAAAAEPSDAVRMALAIDFRYPSSITCADIEQRMSAVAAPYGANFCVTCDKPPYLMDSGSPAIRALSEAYRHVTGEDAKPFTMKGGTYAREFPRAASFGPDKSWEPKPAWVGAYHAANEGISEELLKQTLAIYVHAIDNLMHVEL